MVPLPCYFAVVKFQRKGSGSGLNRGQSLVELGEILSVHPSNEEGSQDQLERSEGQPEGFVNQPEGSEDQLEGSEGQPKRSEGQQEGSKGQ